MNLVVEMVGYQFLANMNSCARSLFAVARPSVWLSVCLSSVTFVRPTQAVHFGNISMALGTLAHDIH